jgi:aerobic-type carbon monoxide dehydrogenase small subunit (CoxS/CutS family)
MLMPDRLSLSVNGKTISVPIGSTVAVAVSLAGSVCRYSVTGHPRAALCGMGICFECRVTVDGKPHCLSCQMLCKQDMDVRTDG